MRRKRGFFSLIEDVENYRFPYKREEIEEEPIHTYRDKNEEEVAIYKPKPELAKSKSVDNGFYDFNNPISLSFSNSIHYGTPFSQANEADYYVEPFEEEAPQVEVKKEHTPVEAKPTEAEPTQTTEKELPNNTEPEDAIIINDPNPKPLPVKTPPAEKMPVDPDDVKKETLPMDDAAFAKDLQAILLGQKQYDADQKRAVPVGEGTRKEPKRPDETKFEDEMEKKKNEHAIFDKIAQSMQLANSYDLGSINLENRFDAFDEALDKKAAEKKKVNNPSLENDSPPAKSSDYKSVGMTEFLEDMDQITQAQTDTTHFLSTIPLSPANGGRIIKEADLEEGDLILSTGKDAQLSGQITQAAIYIGNGQIIETAPIEPKKVPLHAAINDDLVTVALRHQDMDKEKASQIEELLQKQPSDPNLSGKTAKIQNLKVQILPAFCSTLGPDKKDKCQQFEGPIFLGTINNNEFHCARLLLSAFEKAQMPLTNPIPKWIASIEPAQLLNNSKLQYVGHLKIN